MLSRPKMNINWWLGIQGKFIATSATKRHRIVVQCRLSSLSTSILIFSLCLLPLSLVLVHLYYCFHYLTEKLNWDWFKIQLRLIDRFIRLTRIFGHSRCSIFFPFYESILIEIDIYGDIQNARGGKCKCEK